MNVLSTSPFAASILCLVLASCHPITSSDPHIKTVVWDIHGAQPASGRAFLVQLAAPEDGMWPNPWTLLSDTLSWDPSTGEIEWPHVPLDAWWHIESSAPCQAGTTRVDRFPANTDTCRMTSQTKLHLSGKMHRTLGIPVTGYQLEFKAPGVEDWQTAETWNMNHGVIQRVLHLPLGGGTFLTFRPVGWKWCRCEHPRFRLRSQTAFALQVGSGSCQTTEEISTLWIVEFVGAGTSNQSAIQQRFQGRQITPEAQP